MNIGKKIKELRKQKNVTQEQLAQHFNISAQAISKWENNIALPDITLIPDIASYFGVHTDDIFEFSLKQEQEDICRICDEAFEYRKSNPESSRKILEKGLSKYPGNDVLMSNLLYSVDYKASPDETIRIANAVMDKTVDVEIRYDALRFLAYAYSAKGDEISAAAAINQIPELYFTKLSEAALVLKGKNGYEAAEKQKWISFETMLQMLQKTAEYYKSLGENEKSAKDLKCALDFIKCMGYESKISNFKNYAELFEKELKQLYA